MLKSQFKEGVTNRAELSIEDKEVTHGMIRFLYGFDYYVDHDAEGKTKSPKKGKAYVDRQDPAYPVPVSARMHPIVLHAKMYVVADVYDIGRLRALALQKFLHALVFEPSAEMIIQAAVYIYDNTCDQDLAMRNVVVNALIDYDGLLNNPIHSGKIKGRADVMYDVAKRYSEIYWAKSKKRSAPEALSAGTPPKKRQAIINTDVGLAQTASSPPNRQ